MLKFSKCKKVIRDARRSLDKNYGAKMIWLSFKTHHPDKYKSFIKMILVNRGLY